MLRGQARILDRLRLLHLHDQLAGREHCLGIGKDFCAHSLIGAVSEADRITGLCFDEDLVACPHQLCSARRRQADAIFMNLDLSGDANAHGDSPGFTAIRVSPEIAWKLPETAGICNLNTNAA